VKQGKPTGALGHSLGVAIYARVSTLEQAEDEVPIAAQVKECYAHAAKQGWQVVATFKDEGMSGSSDDRPEFKEMIAQAKDRTKPFDAVLVWKYNRLSRKAEHRLAYFGMLRRRGVRVVSIKEPELEGSMAVLVEPLLAAVDEFYIVQIAEDTLRGLKEIARQGYSAGGRPPKGYRAVKKVVGLKRNGEPIFRTAWEPDPEWQDKALKAFEMAAQGRPAQEIIAATGVVRNRSSLSVYLRNPAFVGQRLYKLPNSLGDQNHPPPESRRRVGGGAQRPSSHRSPRTLPESPGGSFRQAPTGWLHPSPVFHLRLDSHPMVRPARLPLCGLPSQRPGLLHLLRAK